MALSGFMLLHHIEEELSTLPLCSQDIDDEICDEKVIMNIDAPTRNDYLMRLSSFLLINSITKVKGILPLTVQEIDNESNKEIILLQTLDQNDSLEPSWNKLNIK